ncbi:MAG: FHA domain-containing protein [Clostridia bacterium]|nr:FHA domain-containing protein [Clostridia bacterium]MCI9184933.1 FHA domain-containing protein [Lachnospiraceae bacterium]
MDELKDFISDNPWIILVVAAVLLVVIFIAVVIILLTKKKGKGSPASSFEVLDDITIDPHTPPQAPIRTAPVPPVFDDEDRTRKLFDYYPDTGLKSYQLELYDLSMQGQVYRVNVMDTITIGRSPDCMICISNPTMSGRHCEIILRNGKLYIRDLNSTNGTFLNGVPNRVTEAELDSGSVVEMGSAKFQVQISLISG